MRFGSITLGSSPINVRQWRKVRVELGDVDPQDIVNRPFQIRGGGGTSPHIVEYDLYFDEVRFDYDDGLTDLSGSEEEEEERTGVTRAFLGSDFEGRRVGDNVTGRVTSGLATGTATGGLTPRTVVYASAEPGENGVAPPYGDICIRIRGSLTGNGVIYQPVARMNPRGNNDSLTFWMRGTAPRRLSLVLTTATTASGTLVPNAVTSPGAIFTGDLTPEGLTEAGGITVVRYTFGGVSANDYGVAPVNLPNWTQFAIRFVPGSPAAAFGVTTASLAIRAGGGSDELCDLYFDEFLWQNDSDLPAAPTLPPLRSDGALRAFVGSDFERGTPDDQEVPRAGGSYVSGTRTVRFALANTGGDFFGSTCMKIEGQLTGNGGVIYQAPVKMNPRQGRDSLTFWVKGTGPGRLALGLTESVAGNTTVSATSPAVFFDTDLTDSVQENDDVVRYTFGTPSNSWGGSVNLTDWRKIAVQLTGTLADFDEKNTYLSIRSGTGGGGTCELYFDEFLWENDKDLPPPYVEPPEPPIRPEDGALRAFPGSDFEGGVHGQNVPNRITTSLGGGSRTVRYAAANNGSAFHGTTCMHITGDLTGTAVIYQSTLPMNARGNNDSLTFWMRGTGAGRLALGLTESTTASTAISATSPAVIFDQHLNDSVQENSVVRYTFGTPSNSWGGSVNLTAWRKIAVRLTGTLADFDEKDTYLSIRSGGVANSTCDLYFDEFLWEKDEDLPPPYVPTIPPRDNGDGTQSYLAFLGSDFEHGVIGQSVGGRITSGLAGGTGSRSVVYAEADNGAAFFGNISMRIHGTLSGSGVLHQSIRSMNPKGDNDSLTFWVRGSTNRVLSVGLVPTITSGNADNNAFSLDARPGANLENLRDDAGNIAEYSFEYAAATPNVQQAMNIPWTKVVITLTPLQLANFDETKHSLIIRSGGGTTANDQPGCDLYFDEFLWEKRDDVLSP
jgi:hypothetical protein